jgi:hypothetical protein
VLVVYGVMVKKLSTFINMEDKEHIKLLYEKIDLLEKFLLEISKAATENNWTSTDEQMEIINELSSKLDEVQDKLNNI